MSEKVYRNTVEFTVRGDYALFSDILTRPGGEKSSYPVPTYEAIKGVLHSVYWKPTIIWYIDSVRIMKKIRMERKGIRPIKYGGGNDLAFYTYLRDVEYQVRAHFDWNYNRPELACDRNENKHHNIAKRMIESGGRRDVFLGTRECMAYVEPCIFGEGEGAYDAGDYISFGLMYHGVTYADEAICPEDKDKLTVRLWEQSMTNGIIDFPLPNEEDDGKFKKRHIRGMKIKSFGKEHENFSGIAEFEGGGEFELD